MADAESIFFAALKKPTPAERDAYLAEACGGDAELRRRVERLLAAAPQVGSFLEAPASQLPTRVLGPGEAAGAAGAAVGAGAVLAGRYLLAEEIGKGGMGTVWLAHQTEPVRRTVAVKLTRDGGDALDVLARFEAERQALALMDHPNIANVFDAGTAPDGRPFFAMEMIAGAPITRHCDDRRLGLRDRLGLFIDVCRAVQHAHQKGVIHRDLKPSNVLVAEYDGKPVPKVIDFGVAKAVAAGDRARATGAGSLVGTPAYMSPEQAGLGGLDVDTRSDVYALGVLLYELLTGSTPFGGRPVAAGDALELLRATREDEPRPPSARADADPRLPALAAARGVGTEDLPKRLRGELDWIALKALEKDRSRRYESASALGRDVQRHLSDDVIEARPPTAGCRLRKFVRRHRALVAGATATFLALACGAAGTTWGMVEARRQGAAAETARQGEAARARAELSARQEEAKQRTLADRRKQAAEESAARATEQARVAKEQTRIATEQTQVATAALDFLRNKVFGQANARRQANALARAGADPAAARPDPTVRELLDRAAVELTPAAIDRHVPNRRLQVDLLQVVGDAYAGVGEYDKAIDLMRRAVALRKELAGEFEAGALYATAKLGSAYHRAGNPAEAIRHLEAARDAIRAHFRVGPRDPLLLAIRQSLALAYLDAGRGAEAVRLLEDILEASAAGRRGAGSVPEAMSHLALAYQSTGRFPEAAALFVRARDAFAQKLGPGHPDTLTATANLASAYRATGKWTLAIPLLEQACDGLEAVLGLDHPDTITALTELAAAREAAGVPGQALAAWERAAEGVELRQYRHPGAAQIVDRLTGLMEADRQFDRAEAWHRKWLAAVRRRNGRGSESSARALAALGANLVRQRKWAEAEAALGECLAIRKAKEPDSWARFDASSLLGDSLLGQARYTEAEPLLVAGYEGLRQRAGAIPEGPIRLADAAGRMVRFCEATGKSAEAAKWLDEQWAWAETPTKP